MTDAVATEPLPAVPSLNLTNHFLIAMPSMRDPGFSRALVYVCEHNERGALGLVVNKPSELSLPALFQKIELTLQRQDLDAEPVFQGGPVHPERGFVLHEAMHAEGQIEGDSIYASSMRIPGGLEMTTSRDVLEAIANGAGPRHLLFTLGFSSWGEGQLESELGENSWLTVAAEPHILFGTPVEDRWQQAMGLLGLQPHQLSAQAGRA